MPCARLPNPSSPAARPTGSGAWPTRRPRLPLVVGALLLALASGPQPGAAQSAGGRAVGGFVTVEPARAASAPAAVVPRAPLPPVPPAPPTPAVVAAAPAPTPPPVELAPTRAGRESPPAREARPRERAARAATPATPSGVAPASASTMSLAGSAVGVARCTDDEPVEIADTSVATTSMPSMRGADASAPRTGLQTLLTQALERSRSIGAARLLAEAAELDIDEARAAGKPSAALTLNAGGVINQQDGLPTTQGAQARAGVLVSAPLFDGGRIAETTGWRRHLAEAARQGRLSAEEQVALQTVQLALDRNRFRLQSQVYRQYARKMGCLVEALEVIVSRDRGRQSELVQAQKTQAQAEIARQQAQASLRQVEIRLRRLVGDGLPPADGLGSVLLRLPPVDDAMAAAERAPEVAQLRAQADAQDSITRIVDSQGRPQVNWVVSGGAAAGAGNPRNLAAGLSVTVPLLTPGLEPAAGAARKRAEAARLQVADAVEDRRTRVADVHDQASTAFERARRTAEVLRDTDRVRQSTLQQWQQLGRRSLFDVMGAEAEHYNLRVAYINALTDGQQAVALLSSMAGGVRQQID